MKVEYKIVLDFSSRNSNAAKDSFLRSCEMLDQLNKMNVPSAAKIDLMESIIRELSAYTLGTNESTKVSIFGSVE